MARAWSMHEPTKHDTVQARMIYLSIDLLRTAVSGARRNEVYDIRALSSWRDSERWNFVSVELLTSFYPRGKRRRA
jgi:hypothetical protein